MRWFGLVVGLAACAGGEPAGDDTSDDTQVDVPAALGRCDYTNTFSDAAECREYVGSGWTLESAEAQCGQASIAASAGTFVPGQGCPTADILGVCRIDAGTPDELILVFPGTDPGACGGVAIGCGFGGGTFEPAPICGDDPPPDAPAMGVFRPFEQVCVEPMAGEDPGDGEVCTWQAISACTEPGREYVDYASCEPVLTQRPYAPYTVSVNNAPDDARLSDAAYMEELAWVESEVRACACTCCHSDAAPRGPSGWDVDQGALWIDGLDDDGLAMLAGWVDSTAFGAFDPADNNGFDRSVTGLPTSDTARMVAFLEGELARRGLSRGDFAETPPFGGVLYDQLVFEPGRCTGGEGVAGGAVTWTGGGARYVYLLEVGSMSPGVPPNLDTPDGTLWRIDVSPDADAVASGIAYGEAPAGARTVVPKDGPAPVLTVGEDYYLVVLRDVYQPLTRCVFTYGG